MTKTIINPETGKKSNRKALEKKLAEAEEKLLTFRTPTGAFGQCIVIAAFRNALGLPIPAHFNQQFYGSTPKWETAGFSNGCPHVQMEKERKVWENVDAQDQEVAFIRHSGWDLVQVNRLNQPGNHLTNKEWQYWLDLMGAAPKLLNAAEQALCLLDKKKPLNNDELRIFRLLREAIEETQQNTKNWKD